MLSSIKDALGILFKWGLLAIVFIIVFKLISSFLPQFSQGSIKDMLSGNASSSESSGKSWLSNFYPGSYSGGVFDTSSNNFKYKAIINPSFDTSSSSANVDNYDWSSDNNPKPDWYNNSTNNRQDVNNSNLNINDNSNTNDNLNNSSQYNNNSNINYNTSNPYNSNSNINYNTNYNPYR